MQDASLFNLDNQMSLSAFQTFIKTRLTCQVKVKATPRTWRLRKDEFNFFYDEKWGFTQSGTGLNLCLDSSGCVGRCSDGYYQHRDGKYQTYPECYIEFFCYSTRIRRLVGAVRARTHNSSRFDRGLNPSAQGCKPSTL